MVPLLIVIAGATATGKSALSLELGERLGGAEILSADSRQVYRGMDIGTAKVPPAERRGIAHHGLDLVDPDEAFSAAAYRRHAFEALHAIAARGGVALLVGGTGLYLRAVARDVPLDESGHDPDLRRTLEERLAAHGLNPLVAELRARAPSVAASIDLANPRRVLRALERAAIHGDRPPDAPRGYPGRVLWLGLDASRADHDRRIADRVAWQFDHGLADEAEALHQRYPEDLRAFSAVGYREAFDLLSGRITRERAIERAVIRTRQYARRQRTWFRSEPDVTWLPGGSGATERALARIREGLGL
jgi:tRNA dimethylallyltransferase